MRSGSYHLSIGTAWADALFASALQRSDEPSAAQVGQAISAAIQALGALGCAARVAQASGASTRLRARPAHSPPHPPCSMIPDRLSDLPGRWQAA
jgi:hypothetical protein